MLLRFAAAETAKTGFREILGAAQFSTFFDGIGQQETLRFFFGHGTNSVRVG